MFRKRCTMQVAKNSLDQKAMEAAGGDFWPIYDVLKGWSYLLLKIRRTSTHLD